MPCEAKPRFLVLYGSQKGQAQSIAEGIAEEAEDHGLVAELSCLNQNEKYNLEKENAPVVFIVSTTGDGEPPDNALQFVKRIKKKTLSTDHYKHLCYALLALGDTNYENFCNCGKTIERRLQELGAKQFYATGYADDGVGLEVVVDPWLEGLWKAIKGALSKMASDRTGPLKGGAEDSPKETPDSYIPDVQLNLLSLNDHQSCESVGASVDTNAKYASAASSSAPDTQTAVSDLRPASTAGSPMLASQSHGTASVSTSAPETQTGDVGVPHDALAASLTCSLPPLSESSLNVPALPPPYLDVSLQDMDIMEPIVRRLNSESLHEVPIYRAVQMTRGDSVKTSLLLELDISANPMLAYQPGDSFDVFCPNRATEVEDMLHRLGLQDQRNHHVHVSLKKDTKKKGAQVPSHIPQNISLLYLLTWCLEIRSVPKKAFLRALVEHTGDSVQRRRLQELCSKQGATDYNLYVRDSNLSVLELLAAFPSCWPPLSLLIEHLPKLQPRPYSAASSCLKHPGKLHFVFNVVEFPACSGRPAGRRGLCTGWLFDLINPGLVFPGKPECSGSRALPKIHVSLRPYCSFRPPSDLSVPFIMVGPGTGVAPFIGFLQQREKERQENPEAVFGETWLFFGCRHRDRDYLFREELEGFVSSGILNHLKVCFSRGDEQEQEEKEITTSVARPRYVQHNLLLNSQYITEILLRQNGCLYVCGDAKNMAKDVNDTLIEMIKTELQVDQLEAMKRLAGLREEKRYLQDIWG
ncbi:methionine synthase reductase isoform X2 [Seriola dumerili]|uniref:Methionine synthase reductase n=2 Tax=Seriola dumerili TaxID=41447 RepID=A0A3B4TAB8_SERDU|nr:methionine synthase reductase isoform X2 [Seriola dumerili]XP_022621949.1 methionine synthase reductase isoform X2 [Seriola dumerili]XP_022621950.1 methionine synthase reductase isoform X2 [Seriola dumerili]XP_022621951.1 methionine synthase reductase isoform X2 [Seriola dumerili]XP_022621952.1 methionine synthase reductase isoform X2 [Seriola dumerili]